MYFQPNQTLRIPLLRKEGIKGWLQNDNFLTNPTRDSSLEDSFRMTRYIYTLLMLNSDMYVVFFVFPSLTSVSSFTPLRSAILCAAYATEKGET